MAVEKVLKKMKKTLNLMKIHLDKLKIQNPCHRKIYIPMETDKNVKVGMKEVLNILQPYWNINENPPIPIYDTLGHIQTTITKLI